MPRVNVFVTLKPSLLDAQGRVVQEGLHSLGYNEVSSVRIGKFLELDIEGSENLDERVHAMCEKFLANTVIENFRFEVVE